MDPSAPSKPRSPWVYVLLGCAGFALLSCLGVGLFTVFVGKKVNDMAEGFTDPAKRAENAKKQLGGIPTGYYPAASFSVFGMMDTTILTDAEPLPDGGFAGDMNRMFLYFRMMAVEQNKKTKSFFTSDSNDTSSLRQSGINLDAKDIVKRGNLTVDGKKLYYVVSRGRMDTGPQGQGSREGLNNAMLFDCPGEALHVGVWTMKDPAPQKVATDLDLTGTVADEAEIAKFVKPMNPCGN